MNQHGDVRSPAKDIKRRKNLKNSNHIKRNHGGKTNRKRFGEKRILIKRRILKNLGRNVLVIFERDLDI